MCSKATSRRWRMSDAEGYELLTEVCAQPTDRTTRTHFPREDMLHGGSVGYVFDSAEHQKETEAREKAQHLDKMLRSLDSQDASAV